MSNLFALCHEAGLALSNSYPLSEFCSFRSGGNAEYFFAPQSEQELLSILEIANKHKVPITILGDGSNTLPPDTMLKGLVISTHALSSVDVQEDIAILGAGTTVYKASAILAKHGKRGLDFLYGMPGTMGGALWMNARCYGKEISDILISARGYTLEGKEWVYNFDKNDFNYKKSPFQDMDCIICECSIKLTTDKVENIWQDMLSHEMDRQSKGHYIAPCAGSVFKNNYTFNSPSGALLDQLGWRNQSCQDARVSPFHANIIINDGQAKSQDIYELSMRMQASVEEKLGYHLEHEIIFLGEETQWKT